MMKTILLKLGWNGENLENRDWIPWSGKDGSEPAEMELAAVSQAIRHRIGGDTRYKGKPARLEVWRHDPDTDLKHIPSGKPFRINQSIYQINPL